MASHSPTPAWRWCEVYTDKLPKSTSSVSSPSPVAGRTWDSILTHKCVFVCLCVVCLNVKSFCIPHNLYQTNFCICFKLLATRKGSPSTMSRQRQGQTGLAESPQYRVTEIGLKTRARLMLSHKATETRVRIRFVLKAQTRAKMGPNRDGSWTWNFL